MSNKIYTPATPDLIELWCSYSGAKSGDIDTVKSFSNTNQDLETGYFTAESSVCTFFITLNHTKVTEQEFINVIYNRYESKS